MYFNSKIDLLLIFPFYSLLYTCDAKEKFGLETPFFKEISEAAAEDPFRFLLLFAGLEASSEIIL